MYTKKLGLLRVFYCFCDDYFLSAMVFCCLILFFFVAFFEYFINRFLDCGN